MRRLSVIKRDALSVVRVSGIGVISLKCLNNERASRQLNIDANVIDGGNGLR